ncbi:MAG: CHASE2 domain-containing protein [Cyanobacteria bacterium P01_F01_bin.150]
MATSSNPTYSYQPGGSLPPDSPTYVKRQADADLYQSLLAGIYCYILNARQMGKSSLRIRTMKLLEQQGIACTDIELSGIGSQQITSAQWYGGMIQELVSGFGLSFKRRAWMQEREDLSPVQRLSQFIETVLLTQITTPMVVFIDEIDSVLSLGFPTDEFFALIRHCYEKRATNENYQRLTFVLLGVATPSDLMRSKQYSPPFNIGRAIPLQGFHIDNCGPLIQGLGQHVQKPRAVLEEILYWSGGQPFLTQKLCWLLAHHGSEQLFNKNSIDSNVQNDVATLVNNYVVQNWEAEDEPEHLRTIRDRLLREGQANQAVFQAYQQILKTGSIPLRDSPEHVKLRLTGIVEVDRGYLRIKNPIYATIFSHQWIEQEIKALPSLTKILPVTTTLVFSGVDGFMEIMAENEYHALSLIQRDFILMKQYAQRFDGSVLKTLGDQLMVSFETAEQGMQYAIEVQKALATAGLDRPPQENLCHRIGIHMGEIVVTDDDLMGTDVTITTLIQANAIPGGICLSEPVFTTVSRHLVTDVIDIGEHGILRFANPIQLYQIPPNYLPNAVDRSLKRWWMPDPVAIALGLGVTAMVTAASFLGWLEAWELNAFDHWMRSRPDEGADHRLMLVTITEADVQSQPIEDRGAASLSDETLARLLTILNQGHPRVIGLDVYRQRQVDRRYPELTRMLSSNDRLFSICYYGDPGLPPPPEVPPHQHGFNSVVQDADGVLRRQILAVTAPVPCQNPYSFNWWLAQTYLQDEGIQQVNQADYLQLGPVPFRRVQSNTGGYRRINPDGHQILLNYRATAHIAETITLQEILSEQFDPNRVKDRIVLIGVVAPTFNDHDWFTPYSSGSQNPRRMSGVEIQAHMTSQIISAVLDGRPLIWSWSEPIEMLWIGVWTIGASVVSVKMRSRRYLTLMVGTMVLGLSGICWILMIYGGWIPFIAPVVGMVGTGAAVSLYRAALVHSSSKAGTQYLGVCL